VFYRKRRADSKEERKLAGEKTGTAIGVIKLQRFIPEITISWQKKSSVKFQRLYISNSMVYLLMLIQ
jgi:hypothetical protein